MDTQLTRREDDCYAPGVDRVFLGRAKAIERMLNTQPPNTITVRERARLKIDNEVLSV